MTHQELPEPDIADLHYQRCYVGDVYYADTVRRLVQEAVQPVTIAQALESNGCERIKDFYQVGPVQRAAVESFAAALGHCEPVNQMLLDSLRELVAYCDETGNNWMCTVEARAAIKAAEQAQGAKT